VNITETTNNTTIVNKDVDKAGDFGRYIIENRPKWYNPGKWIEKNKLYEKYLAQYDVISKPLFHKIFMDKVFNKQQRVTKNGVKITKVLLLKYDEIITFED